MKFGSLSLIFYTVTILLPGFIIHNTLNYLIPRKGLDKRNLLFKVLLYSSLPLSLFLFIFGDGLQESGISYILVSESRLFGWVGIVLILPVILAVLWAQVLISDKIRETLIGWGYFPLRPEPSAWDYKFHNTQEERYVIVKLSTGKEVRGLYSGNSCSSSNAQERDIYLEDLMDEDWEWKDFSDGIWLSSDEVVSIEFISNPTEK